MEPLQGTQDFYYKRLGKGQESWDRLIHGMDLHRGLGAQKSGGRTEELPENWQLGLQHKQISNISMIKILVPAKGNILILPSKYLKAVLNEIQPKSATKPGQA